MISDARKVQEAGVLLEALLDAACIDAGMSETDVEQSKRVAAIEERLVANGRSIKDIYKEWETKTPEQIINEYEALPAPIPYHSQIFETDWLPVTFRALEEKPQTVVLFDVQTMLANKTLWQGAMEAIVEDVSLTEHLTHFTSGQKFKARFKVCYCQMRLVPILTSIEAD